MNDIIVGVDGSPHAANALRWAVDYGTTRDWPITALLAWDYIVQQHVDPDEGFDPAYGSDAAARVLDELICKAVGSDTAIARQVVCDHAGPALIEAAGDDASLIVVGARGMNGFKGLLLGSVSRHVLHAATQPVAVIRSEPSHPDGPIVVGIDGSEPSRRALAWAVADAEASHRRIVAVHAWTPPSDPLGYPWPGGLDDQEASARRLLEQDLEHVDQLRLAAPIELATPQQRASAALLDAARTASMIVVGSRGKGQISRILLGSVSDQVSHHATCPVIVVP